MATQVYPITRLYLIRHGESYPNVEPIVGGMKGDAGLTDLGVAQARALRDRLAASGEIQADTLIASTLPRARQTAEIIAPALGLDVELDDEVQELRPGEADGMHVGDLKARFGIPDFRNNPYQPFAPGAESWPLFVVRVGNALTRIAREHSAQTTVIVCHGGVIDVSFLVFMQMHSLSFPTVEFNTRNTSITQWERHDRPDRPPRWRLVRYNDDRHLVGLAKQEEIDWSAVEPREDEGDHQSVPLPTEDDGQV